MVGLVILGMAPGARSVWVGGGNRQWVNAETEGANVNWRTRAGTVHGCPGGRQLLVGNYVEYRLVDGGLGLLDRP